SCAVTGLYRRPWTIGRQLKKRRRCSQLFLPERRELAKRGAAKRSALPLAVIDVLHRQFRQFLDPVRGMPVIESPEIIDDDAERKAICNDVVDDADQHVLVRRQTHK